MCQSISICFDRIYRLPCRGLAHVQDRLSPDVMRLDFFTHRTAPVRFLLLPLLFDTESCPCNLADSSISLSSRKESALTNPNLDTRVFEQPATSNIQSGTSKTRRFSSSRLQ